MDEYRLMLEQLSGSDSSSIISNSSTEHAIPLIAKLFQRGKQEVFLFTGSLNPKIYAIDEVVASVTSFLLGKGGKLKIIIQNDEETVPDDLLRDESSLIGRLRERLGQKIVDQISLFRADEHAREIGLHFMVVDGTAFRLEPDITKHEAFASFNNASTAAKLKGVFEKFLEKNVNKISLT